MNEEKPIKNTRNKKAEESTEEADEEEKKIDTLKKAGEIAQKVKTYIKPKIQVGAMAREIISDMEKKIEELGGLCAFPVNLSINNIAAHYTSPIKDDGLKIEEEDIVKLDLGVHIDGYIVDTAFTVNFNSNEELKNIVTATETALEAVKMMIKPGVHTREIGTKIEKIIKDFNYRPIKQLGGHQIERWIVHGTKKLPNLGTQGGNEVEVGDIFAIEIFASTGLGSVHSTNTCEIYGLNPFAGRVPLRRKSSRRILGYINNNYKTLPFAERWLAEEFQIGVSFGLQELIRQGKIETHYVLSEESNAYIAQSEETVLITEEGYQQLT
ncbi:MAG: Methionine aminopeptidase [Promethearchaeota archaeon]|nr:MAG: Methionine aminopeptidase [Candidatus Lokiarchaeota archaeon]